ncbi:MAG: hypothetical protein V4472_25535 [Pseudomonadota bacterium]
MYDSITASQCPSDGDLYLGYLDGAWPSYNDMVRLFPNAIHVPCTVFASDNEGLVGDCENGDMTPQTLVTWVVNRRRSGADPTGYCNFSTWPAARAAFQAAGVAEPHWLIAGYAQPPDPSIPAGAIGHQYADPGPYDISSVADFWPGVDQLKVVPMHQPPWVFEPIVADLGCPSGGAWMLAASGALYAVGGAPFVGGVNGKPFFAGRTAATLELPDAAGKAAGYQVIIVDTAGERYGEPGS